MSLGCFRLTGKCMLPQGRQLQSHCGASAGRHSRGEVVCLDPQHRWARSACTAVLHMTLGLDSNESALPTMLKVLAEL